MKLRKVQSNFTQVSNVPLYDKKLSWKAKGLYAYLYSKPDGWEFSGDRITKDSSDGRKATYAALKELEDANYLQRLKLPSGKMEYVLDVQPIDQKGQEGSEPVDQNGKEPKRQSAEKGSISNIESISNTDKESKTGTAGRAGASEKKKFSQEGAEVIEAFAKFVNPTCKRYYSNTTQRAAADALIEDHGKEKVLHIIENVLPKTNQTAFITKATTPNELMHCWAKIGAQVVSEQAKLKAKQVHVLW